MANLDPVEKQMHDAISGALKYWRSVIAFPQHKLLPADRSSAEQPSPIQLRLGQQHFSVSHIIIHDSGRTVWQLACDGSIISTHATASAVLKQLRLLIDPDYKPSFPVVGSRATIAPDDE